MSELGYADGFRTLSTELTRDELPVLGTLPPWLAGTLVRNGPAMFDHGGKSLRHWFDGQAMLHRFAFDDGVVSYTNRLLVTPGSTALREQGRIAYAEFATDPCASMFGRFFTQFTKKPSANACVNVTRVAGVPLAITETPLAVQFDPETLDTVGVVGYGDKLGGPVTTAHPHAVPGAGDLVNYVLKFGRHSCYRVYRQSTGDPVLLGEIPADLPGYVHSFAVTTRHVVLAVFPLVVHPLSFLLRNRPFIENYRWRPELGLRIVAMSLVDGSITADVTAPAAFAFHHINAFEDDDTIVLDMTTYPTSAVVEALYLDRLRAGGTVPLARPTRYRVVPGSSAVSVERISDEALELPRINYAAHNGRPYRYVYGVGASSSGVAFNDRLVKIDVTTGESVSWAAEDSYPGEPVFVPSPAGSSAEGSGGEDDGVVLSVVLDAARGHSTLVVLDASTFAELARVDVPHAIPFGFHGQFSSRR